MYTVRLGMLALALAAAAACQQTRRSSQVPYGPKPEEMRTALLQMMDTHPEIAVAEFRTSLEHDVPVEKDGIVYIGSWNCDPKLMSFEADFSGANLTMFMVSGSFEVDNRGIWKAVPRQVQPVTRQDIGEIWRASDIEPH